jgi:hypothetical protein
LLSERGFRKLDFTSAIRKTGAFHLNRRDTMRNIRIMSFAFWSTALLVMPSYSAAQEKNTDGTPNPRPATAQQVDDLTKSFNDYRAIMKTAVDRLGERLAGMDEKLDQETRALRARGMTTDLNVATAQKDINDLKDQLARIRQDLDAMRGRSGETRSFYQGPNQLPPGTGRVRMTNTFFSPVAVAVNGAVYNLMPGEQRYSAAIPAGTFTYEVLGIQAPTQRTLAAGETYTVDVYPR